MKLPLVFLVLLTARKVFIAMVIICLNLIFLCIQIALVENKQFNLSLAESHITYWINCIELRIYIILLLQLSYVPTFFLSCSAQTRIQWGCWSLTAFSTAWVSLVSSHSQTTSSCWPCCPVSRIMLYHCLVVVFTSDHSHFSQIY